MSKKDESEQLLNDTIGAYVESTGHLPSQDQMPEIVTIVHDYVNESHNGEGKE